MPLGIQSSHQIVVAKKGMLTTVSCTCNPGRILLYRIVVPAPDAIRVWQKHLLEGIAKSGR